MKAIAGLLLLFVAVLAAGQQTSVNDTLIPAHDPVLIREDSTYYVFCTGQGISVFSSPDLKHWRTEAPVFASPPDWALKAVPGFKGHIWAPDISYQDGKFYLYYSVSAFGKNTSCIGVAVNTTLNPRSAAYHWQDMGKVIQSVPGRDMWNAIDPNLSRDENNIPWLVFGSFWNGIKMVRLQKDLVSLAEPQTWFTVASRKRNPVFPDSVAGDAAIEAPFIYKKGRYFYLFVSFDYCCRGEKSTYKIMVGRSEKICGPYSGKDGTPMTLGGGSLVLQGDRNWNGVGHNAVAGWNGIDYLVYHGYDANDRGKPKLKIEKLSWHNGWPAVERKTPF